RDRDRRREAVGDHERQCGGARNTGANRAHHRDRRAVRIDDRGARVLHHEAALHVVCLRGLGVREPHLRVDEICSGAEVDGRQRHAGTGVGDHRRALRGHRAVDLGDARITLRTLRPHRSLRSLRSGVTLRALRSGVTLGARRPLRARVALRPLRAGITLVTVVTVVAFVTLRALRALGTSAVEDVAGSVVVDVLGVEVALVVLVEVPAAHAVPPLVSFRTRVALWPLRPVVTLGTLRAAVALVTLRALRAGIADVALRTLGPRRPASPFGPCPPWWPSGPSGPMSPSLPRSPFGPAGPSAPSQSSTLHVPSPFTSSVSRLQSPSSFRSQQSTP